MIASLLLLCSSVKKENLKICGVTFRFRLRLIKIMLGCLRKSTVYLTEVINIIRCIKISMVKRIMIFLSDIKLWPLVTEMCTSINSRPGVGEQVIISLTTW